MRLPRSPGRRAPGDPRPRAQVTDNLADTCAELAAIAWREVKASRDASHGRGPASRADGPSRSAKDRTAALSEAILERLVKAVVKRVIIALVSWPDLGLEDALLKLRVLTLTLCPDPAGHELVWTNCWRPLFQMVLQETLADELKQLDQFIDGGLGQPHTWNSH